MADTLIRAIASTCQSYHYCVESDNQEWAAKHREQLEEYTQYLPSGSGIDCGTTIDIDRSNGNRVYLTLGYHHMNENGYYGWTHHTIYVTPSFDGFDLHITGRDRNGIKEYLHETYSYALSYVKGTDGDFYDPWTPRHTYVMNGEGI